MQDPQVPSSASPSAARADAGNRFDTTRPFALGEYEWAFFRFVRTAVDKLIIAKNPVLSRIKAVPSRAIHTSRNTTDDGEVVENPPIRMTLEIAIDFKDVIAGKISAITESINEAAEQGVQIVVPQVSEYMSKVISAFGSQVDLKGAPWDHAAIRQFVEASEIEFDENDKPDLEPWAFTTDGLQRVITFEEMITQFPPRTAEEVSAWDDMIERKRSQFNARRRRRTLS